MFGDSKETVVGAKILTFRFLALEFLLACWHIDPSLEATSKEEGQGRQIARFRWPITFAVSVLLGEKFPGHIISLRFGKV